MTRFQRWMFRRIARQEVRQGYFHREKIKDMYCVVIAAARGEFREDNTITLNFFLAEIHAEALKRMSASVPEVTQAR